MAFESHLASNKYHTHHLFSSKGGFLGNMIIFGLSFGDP